MLLAIDIGNTHTSAVLFKKDNVVARRRGKTSSITTEKKCLLFLSRLSHSEITGAVIASVVPRQTKLFARTIQKQFHLKPLVVNGANEIGIKIR